MLVLVTFCGEKRERQRERERKERPSSIRHANIHDSKQTIRFRTDTLKYVAGKSDVLLRKRALDTVLLFTDLVTQASYSEGASEHEFTSAQERSRRGCVFEHALVPGKPPEAFVLARQPKNLEGCEDSAHRFRGRGRFRWSGEKIPFHHVCQF